MRDFRCETGGMRQRHQIRLTGLTAGDPLFGACRNQLDRQMRAFILACDRVVRADQQHQWIDTEGGDFQIVLYLRRMVTNEHLSWRRRWHVRTIRSASDDELAAHAPAAGDRAHAHAEHDAMWRRLAELPPRQRTVLVLRYYEDLSDPEIATVLDTTAATVRSHAARALATLRRSEHPQQPEKPTKPTLESR